MVTTTGPTGGLGRLHEPGGRLASLRGSKRGAAPGGRLNAPKPPKPPKPAKEPPARLPHQPHRTHASPIKLGSIGSYLPAGSLMAALQQLSAEQAASARHSTLGAHLGHAGAGHNPLGHHPHATGKHHAPAANPTAHFGGLKRATIAAVTGTTAQVRYTDAPDTLSPYLPAQAGITAGQLAAATTVAVDQRDAADPTDALIIAVL